MAGGFQPLCVYHLRAVGSLSLLYTTERRGQFEYDVVSFGHIFCFVSTGFTIHKWMLLDLIITLIYLTFIFQ